MMTDPLIRQYVEQRLHGATHKPDSDKFHSADDFGSNDDSFAHDAGAAIPEIVDRRHLLRPLGSYMELLAHSPLRAALLTGGLGAGAGAIAGKLNKKDPLVSGLVGLFAGGGAASLAGHLMQRNMGKSASAVGAVTLRNKLQQLLGSDTNLGFEEKAVLFPALERLDPARLQELLEILKRSVGIGAGAIIARYLMGLGLLGTAVGAIAGGLIGGGALGPRRNAFGQATNPDHDLFGNPRFF